MPNSDFEVQLGELGRLKNEVYDKIEEIRTLEDDGIDSIETRRNIITKRAHNSINQMNDILSVVELLVSQQAPRKAEGDLLWEKLSLHKLTVRNLKEKLKESQIKAYEQESERVHDQIIEDYVSKWSDKNENTREQLFAGRSTPLEETNDKPIEEQVLTQNKNITNSLKLTKQLMTMSVMQTELNTETLEQQTRDLTKVNDKLVDLDSLLNKSRQIVKFIEKQDKRDKRRIYFSIGFLLLCFAWVVWHRILKLPVKMLTWSLLKMFGVVSWFTSKVHPDPVAVLLTKAHEEVTSAQPLASSVALDVEETFSSVTDVVESLTTSLVEEFTSTETGLKESDNGSIVEFENSIDDEAEGNDASGTTTVSTEEVHSEVEHDTDTASETHAEPVEEPSSEGEHETDTASETQAEPVKLEEPTSDALPLDVKANKQEPEQPIEDELLVPSEASTVEEVYSTDIPEEPSASEDEPLETIQIENKATKVDQPDAIKPSELNYYDAETLQFHEWTPPQGHDEL